MEPEFITYQKFNDQALADELAEFLRGHGVEYFIEEDSLTFNPSFALNDEFAKEYAIKIKSTDFELVNRLLNQEADKDIENVDKDHYLFTFSDAELMDVIKKADEWNAFDVRLARKILADRGVAMSDEEIAEIKRERIDELKKPESSQLGWIITGYVIAVGCIAMPFFISIVGLFIGWHLSRFKKTLPDGSRVYAYNDTDRRHGRIIFFIGGAIFLLKLVIYIYRNVFSGNY
ncbi:MAG TPA: hypothetical protein VHA56_21280 [Mucilaginibacter sp.]|nr:hypothetical protein [Mucilaginibacter sp.]